MENLAKGRWNDPDRVKEFAKSYTSRYGDEFWEKLLSVLPRNTFDTIGDFGCGPGMWLADAANRLSASEVIGLDASEAMLNYAKEVLSQISSKVERNLLKANFDSDAVPLDPKTLDLAFGGYMLHEVSSADSFLTMVSDLVKDDGVCVIFDFVSGDEAAFIAQMMARGMPEERARMRYPHMCKHSIEDIKQIMTNAGFAIYDSCLLRETRVFVAGIKEK